MIDVMLSKATVPMLLHELLTRQGEDGNVLFNANSVPIAGDKVMLTAITPNFTMTWIPEAPKEEE
tara:strand:+ start:2145 stop:2339 length:195 start_codon:yes stop_codon:yes gene_type:complete